MELELAQSITNHSADIDFFNPDWLWTRTDVQCMLLSGGKPAFLKQELRFQELSLGWQHRSAEQFVDGLVPKAVKGNFEAFHPKAAFNDALPNRLSTKLCHSHR